MDPIILLVSLDVLKRPRHQQSVPEKQEKAVIIFKGEISTACLARKTENGKESLLPKDTCQPYHKTRR